MAGEIAAGRRNSQRVCEEEEKMAMEIVAYLCLLSFCMHFALTNKLAWKFQGATNFLPFSSFMWLNVNSGVEAKMNHRLLSYQRGDLLRSVPSPKSDLLFKF